MHPCLYVKGIIMPAVSVIPLFIGFVLSALLGGAAWRTLQVTRSDMPGIQVPRRDLLCVGSLILAALSGGIFLARAVLSVCF